MWPNDFRMSVAVVLEVKHSFGYSWVVRSYIHLYGLEISIKASRRYHGNHQENNMSNDEAPCEAFNLMHILELPCIY